MMYVAMATAMPMDYTLPFKQGTSFQMLLLTQVVHMLAICAVYAITHTSNLQKHGTFLKYNYIVPSVFVVIYVNKLS